MWVREHRRNVGTDRTRLREPGGPCR
jgi:hypothetical protein